MAKDTISTIMDRRSIRRYRPDPIPEEDIQTILEAGRQAPSGGNRQPWRFVVVKDPEIRRRVADVCNGQMWMADAALIVAAVGLPQASRWYIVDPTIALQNMILAATSLGYGTCWIGAFDESRVKEVLGIPADLKVICLTPIGLPDEAPAAHSRKPMGEICSLDRFGRKYEGGVDDKQK